MKLFSASLTLFVLAFALSGCDGKNGQRGIDGLVGPSGMQGLLGPSGLPGADGLTGPPGATDEEMLAHMIKLTKFNSACAKQSKFLEVNVHDTTGELTMRCVDTPAVDIPNG